MNRLRLVWRREISRPSRAESALFHATDLDRAYFPGRGVAYSIGIHVLVLIGLLALSLFRSIPSPPLPANQLSYVHPRLPKVLMYLPMLEPAGRFLAFPAPKAKTGPTKTPRAKASETKGLSYPGPQRIVSDPPNPTNLIQTVLQPDLENPPILVPPLPLPNIVQVADIAAALPAIPLPPLEPPQEDVAAAEKAENKPAVPPAPPEPEPAMVLPALELAPTTRMEAPKIVLPPSITPVLQTRPAERPVKLELPGQLKARALAPEPEPPPDPTPAPPQAKPAESPKTAPASSIAGKPGDSASPEFTDAVQGKKNLLSLTPMPSAPNEPAKVPAGEARGRFVISPEPNLGVTEKEPGLKTGNRSATIAIVKTPAASEAGIAAPGVPAKAGRADGANTEDNRNAPSGGNGSQSRGSAKPGSPSGSGNASGSGRRPFAGITIMGGEVDPGDNPDEASVRRARRPLQTSYGLSIISTENSGGGLPYVGVFSNEQIYTVYLDVRQTELEEDPSWTLEFAVIPGSGGRTDSTSSPARNRQGLILPFPVEKVKPVLPADIVRRHLHKMVIAYGVIGADGKMDQITIEQSPDNQLDEPVFQALSRWIFRPAQLNGETVAAKVLMGIPLWLPE